MTSATLPRPWMARLGAASIAIGMGMASISSASAQAPVETASGSQSGQLAENLAPAASETPSLAPLPRRAAVETETAEPGDLLTPLPDVFDVDLAVTAVPPEGDRQGATGEALAGPGPNTWTVTPMTYEVVTGPNDGLTVTIDTDLYVPSNATAATPAAAILTTHGFGNSKNVPEQRTNAAYLASHGYVVMSYTSQGFGDSSSCIALDGLDYDVKNASSLIDIMADMDIVAKDAPGDPKIGMLGGSYGGGLLALVGGTDPRVDALAIGRTWHTLQFSLDPNNWIADTATPYNLDNYEQGVFKREWTSLFFGLGVLAPAQGTGGCDPITQQMEFPGAVPCPGYIPGICEINAMLEVTGDANDAGRTIIGRSSFQNVIDDLTTPTMFLQGLPDTLFTPTEATAGFTALQQRGVDTAMIWHSGGHGGYQALDGEAEAYGGQYDETPEAQARFGASYLPRRTLQWMDKYVRGMDALDTGPAFAWFRDNVEVDLAATGGTAAPAFGMSDTFPVGEETIFALDPSNASLVNVGSLLGGTGSILNPPGGQPGAYSETANFSSPGGPGDQPAMEMPGQNLAFTTAPFDVTTELVDVPRLRLNLSGAAPVDIRLFGKIYDVDPDGNATLIRRQVAPARFPAAAAAAGPVDMHLVGSVHAFEPGHSLRIVLATTDLAYFNELVPNQITLTSTPETPSLLSIHLLSAEPEPTVVTQTSTPTPAPATSTTPAPGPATAAGAPGAPANNGSMPATGGGLVLAGLALMAASGATRRRKP